VIGIVSDAPRQRHSASDWFAATREPAAIGAADEQGNLHVAHHREGVTGPLLVGALIHSEQAGLRIVKADNLQ
jgi:hypothetical protein